MRRKKSVIELGLEKQCAAKTIKKWKRLKIPFFCSYLLFLFASWLESTWMHFSKHTEGIKVISSMSVDLGIC